MEWQGIENRVKTDSWFGFSKHQKLDSHRLSERLHILKRKRALESNILPLSQATSATWHKSVSQADLSFLVRTRAGGLGAGCVCVCVWQE